MKILFDQHAVVEFSRSRPPWLLGFDNHHIFSHQAGSISFALGFPAISLALEFLGAGTAGVVEPGLPFVGQRSKFSAIFHFLANSAAFGSLW